jgi:hypothetical protein
MPVTYTNQEMDDSKLNDRLLQVDEQNHFKIVID